jgi:IclR family transcriptional regulator, pca regulon regulatory protein
MATHPVPHTPLPPAAPARQPGDSYVQSFARGLEVIRSFSAAAPQQTLTQVATQTGLTRAGARRILLTLQTLGYVDTDGKLFSLTPRILDLGFAYLSSMPIWNLAEPVMEALVKQVKESSSAAVLDGNDIVYVLRVPTHKIMSISLGVGSRLPAYCTSMGRVLLAGLGDDAVQARLAASDIKPLTRHTVTDPTALLATVRSARAQGWCLVNQELEEGLISMAAPVTDRAGRTVAALNISGQANRTSARVMQDTMLPALLDAAGTISRLLGAPRGVAGAR